MRVLTAEDVSTLLRGLDESGARHLLDALVVGLIAYSKEHAQENAEKKIHQPPRIVFKTAKQDVTLVMPVSDSSQTTVKTVTVPSSGDIAGAITIFESEGPLKGVLNAAEITAFRTALAVMTVLVRWPGPDHTNVVVFGAGKQVEWHIRLLLLLAPISSVTVINRGRARLETLANGTLRDLRSIYPGISFSTIAKECNTNYEEDLNASLKDADVICCCTPSREPLFTSEHVAARDDGRPRFLSLIGSYTPEMQEIDTATLKSSHPVFVDSKEACLSEAGELIRARYTEHDLVEIGQWLDQDPSTMIDSKAPLTLVKCVGFGLMDLIVAKALLEMAEARSLGLVVSNF